MHSALPIHAVVRFGVFEADVYSGELRKSGVKIKIQDLPFRALKLLLSNPNEVLSRNRFRQELWPEDVFVDFDHGISSAINRLRDALGDSADNPVFIETIERRGYRWIAPTHVPAGPVLVMPEAAKASTPSSAQTLRWRRLLFPALLLILVIWSLWPKFHPGKASAAHSAPFSAGKSAPALRPANSEAEQFYLKGRFYWEKRTPDGLNKAVDFFTQAIVHEPSYAPAYVGLADCYNLMREYTMMPASDAYPRALAAAQKAVELDDQSSEAHASLAFVLFYGTWKVADAEGEFRRAIELDPNNAIAHHWYATYLFTLGRHSESLQEIERSQSLDPASKAVLADKGDLLWVSGHEEEGAALLKQLEVAEPGFVSPHRYLKGIYFAKGDYSLYLEEWKKEATLMRDNSRLKLVEVAEKGFAAGGRPEMLRNVRELQQKLYERGQESAYYLAETDSLLGNKKDALRYLQIAFDTHDEGTVQVGNDTGFNSLHSEPAYQSLIARIGLPAQK